MGYSSQDAHLSLVLCFLTPLLPSLVMVLAGATAPPRNSTLAFPPLPPLHFSLSCSFLCGSYPCPRGFNLHIRAHYRAFFSSLSRDLLFRSRTQTPMLGVWRTSAPPPPGIEQHSLTMHVL